jgi:predicted  nucleic acid-binding Zn-ribbon protein
MNPFDALFVPPSLFKRALDDLHDIAVLARRYTDLEQTLLARIERVEDELVRTRTGVESLNGEISAVRKGVVALRRQMEPISHLEPIRRGIEPLERSMVSVRKSVDELEPMIADLDRKLREIDPKLDAMQDSIEPIGDLAEKIPGNRRRDS